MSLSLDLFLDQFPGMDQWDTVTAAHLTKTYRQIKKILKSVPCEMPESEKKIGPSSCMMMQNLPYYLVFVPVILKQG